MKVLFRAELDIDKWDKRLIEISIDPYIGSGIIKFNNKYYGIGYINAYGELEVKEEINKDILKFKIKEETKAIHFENMLDSASSPVFASLDSETGKGGDRFKWDNEIFIVWVDNQSLAINATNKDNFESNCHDALQEWFDGKNKTYDFKIVGVQQ